jgi:peptidoglycan/LPS O-acetylase OafA/YrhL
MAIERVRKLNGLTALRFVAAAGVVVYHSEGHFGVPANWGGSWLPLGMGVSFFFVLSGFVLAYVYPVVEDWAQRRKFWQARLARVWPAHIGALLVLWILLRHARNFPMGYGSWWMACINVLMVHGWVPITQFYFSYNAPAWSLSTEVGFYLLFPLLIWRWERTWWWKFLAALAVLGGLIYLCQSGIVPNSSDPWKVQWTGVLVTNPLARVFEFMIGMLGALLYRKTRPRIRMGMMLGTVAEVAAVALMAYNFSHANLIFGWSSTFPHTEALMFWMAHGPVCCLTFALMIYVLALEQGVVSRLLGMSPGVLLGEISFSVYLLHDVILTYYEHHEAYFAGYSGWKVYAGFWTILLLASWLMWAGFERPVRAWLVQLPRMKKKEQEAIAMTGASAGQWGTLFVPSWRALGIGAGTLVACILPVTVILSQPTAVRGAAAQTVAALEERGVRFGDVFELTTAAMDATPVDAGETKPHELTLVWRALKQEPLDYFVGIHFVDDQGKILAQGDFAQDPAESTVRRGEEWVNYVPIPADLPAGVTHIGVCLYKAGKHVQLLMIDRGTRDWGNDRLLIRLK